jgi:hypothetical protein
VAVTLGFAVPLVFVAVVSSIDGIAEVVVVGVFYLVGSCGCGC